MDSPLKSKKPKVKREKALSFIIYYLLFIIGKNSSKTSDSLCHLRFSIAYLDKLRKTRDSLYHL